MKSFSYIRIGLITQSNRFIVDAKTILNENPSVPMINTVDARACMNGNFNDDGFCRMLEPMIVRKLDIIYPFWCTCGASLWVRMSWPGY